MVIDDLKDRVIYFDRLILYGDVHISPKSRKIVNKLFVDNKDIDCLAIELNNKRLNKFKKKPKLARLFGKLLFRKNYKNYLGGFKEAVDICMENKIPIEPIDISPLPKMPFLLVLKSFWHIQRSKSKLSKCVDSFQSIRQNPRDVDNKFVKELLKSCKEREKVMVKNLLPLIRKYKRILVIVGYGHLNPILDLLRQSNKLKR